MGNVFTACVKKEVKIRYPEWNGSSWSIASSTGSLAGCNTETFLGTRVIRSPRASKQRQSFSCGDDLLPDCTNLSSNRKAQSFLGDHCLTDLLQTTCKPPLSSIMSDRRQEKRRKMYLMHVFTKASSNHLCSKCIVMQCKDCCESDHVAVELGKQIQGSSDNYYVVMTPKDSVQPQADTLTIGSQTCVHDSKTLPIYAEHSNATFSFLGDRRSSGYIDESYSFRTFQSSVESNSFGYDRSNANYLTCQVLYIHQDRVSLSEKCPLTSVYGGLSTGYTGTVCSSSTSLDSGISNPSVTGTTDDTGSQSSSMSLYCKANCDIT